MRALDQVQRAQNIYDELEETLEDLAKETAQGVDQDLEDAEAALSQADGAEPGPREDRLEEALEEVRDAQEGVNQLQAAAHEQDVDLDIDAIEDAIEQAEDAITDDLLGGNDGDQESDDEADETQWDVTVSDQKKTLDSRTIEPIELLREFDYDPNQYVLYPCEDEERISKDSEINLAEADCFDAIPSDTAYGEQALEDVLGAEIEDLREDYTVDVEPDAEPDRTHVIIRDYRVPSSAYNMDEVDVMIRVHENYPQQAPDWVYVEPEFSLKGGGEPHKANRNRVQGWLGLSWHINKFDALEWKPLETDLRWYLNNIVHSRLRQDK